MDFFQHPPRPSFYPRANMQNVMLSICHRHQGLLAILQCRFVGGANDERTTPKSQGYDLIWLSTLWVTLLEMYLNIKFSGRHDYHDWTFGGKPLFLVVRVFSFFPCEEHLLFMYFMWQMTWLLKDLSNFVWTSTARIWKELHPSPTLWVANKLMCCGLFPKCPEISSKHGMKCA